MAIQELIDLATGKVFRRTSNGSWQKAAVSSDIPSFPLSVVNGGTGSTGGRASKRNLGLWKELWTGNLSAGGRLTNSQFADYDVFLFDCSSGYAQAMVVVSAISEKDTLMSGAGGVFNGSVFNVIAFANRLSISKNVIDNITCYFTPLNNGGAQTAGNVIAIYGLI